MRAPFLFSPSSPPITHKARPSGGLLKRSYQPLLVLLAGVLFISILLSSCSLDIPYIGNLFRGSFEVDLKPDTYEGTSVEFSIVVKNLDTETIKNLSGYISGSKIYHLDMPESMGYGSIVLNITVDVRSSDSITVEVFGLSGKKKLHAKDTSKRVR